jgi:hypothetical protein
LLSPLQRDNIILNEYIYGSTYSFYATSSTYNFGDRAIGNTLTYQNGVYESVTNSNINNSLLNTTYWMPINSSYLGMDERDKFTNNKIIFEYALNRYYNTTFRQPNSATSSGYLGTHSDIYITDTLIQVPCFIVGGPDNSNNVYRKSSDGFIFGTGSSTTFLNTHFYAASQYNINVPNGLLMNLPSTASNVKYVANELNPAGIRYGIIGY